MINKQNLPDTLISMTDYVLDASNMNIPIREFYRSIKYAKFLNQPLELWMFIPCDENGSPLEKPNSNDDYYRDANGISENFFEAQKEYQEAEDRVIFEGLTFKENNKGSVRVYKNETQILRYDKNRKMFLFNSTIEDLVPYGLKIKKN